MLTSRPLLPLLALAALALLAPAAHAQTFGEMGDAGQTLATAQDASAVTFSQITGSIATPADADLFKIYISSPGTFSASTINTVTNAGGLDTDLFLFDSTGHGIATNDDGSGLSIDAALPAGNALYKNLPAGIYYLGISISGNEPVNANNQLIFTGYPGGDTTAVRGPASGLNPTTLAAFNAFNSDTTIGAYQIDFAGVSAAPAAAPEPSQYAAFAVGLLGLGALAVKAKRRTA